LAFEREDDAGDGERRESEEAGNAALADRSIGVGDDDASREGRELEKSSGSVGLSMSDNTVARETRDDDCSRIEDTSEAVDTTEAGPGRMTPGRTVEEEDCNG
jgi:hypothetical protein